MLFCLTTIIVLACKTKSSEPSTKQEGPNVGGLGMPRGLVAASPNHTDGYIFFNTLLSDTTYLVNKAGQVVHTWDSDYGPAGCTYLKDNGNLIRGGRDPQNTVFDGGGQGGIIQELSWDGDILWEYKFSDDLHMAHHDVAIMPNGNILSISWESKTVKEAVIAGRNPEQIPEAGLWPDMVVEIEPKGKNEGTIVWEWHLWDHLVQNHDSQKANFGQPVDHPELLNINLGDPIPESTSIEDLNKKRSRNNANTNDTPENQGSDLYHINAINYNPTLDQIVLSSPNLNEIFIIDHSTTTAEAATHMGGLSGKGGDILYRWGNPQNYNRGEPSDQILGGQHDVRWVTNDNAQLRNLMVFNNFIPLDKGGYSAVIEITPTLTDTGYAIEEQAAFGPTKPSWQYMSSDTSSFFAPFISGAQRLQNGNTFITVGPKGRYFEVNDSGKVLWDYWTPYSGSFRMSDGTFPQPVGPFVYATFRATHVSIDHPAIRGKNLTPLYPQPKFLNEE
ncbi:MAG: hypothetical protein ACJA01_004179 [Saprospiraceae bacterium]|jgi:hypothetical protein